MYGKWRVQGLSLAVCSLLEGSAVGQDLGGVASQARGLKAGGGLCLPSQGGTWSDCTVISLPLRCVLGCKGRLLAVCALSRAPSSRQQCGLRLSCGGCELQLQQVWGSLL